MVHAILIVFEQSLIKIIQSGVSNWTNWSISLSQSTNLDDQWKLAEYQWLAEFAVVNLILGKNR
jgi:hypothetical protein